MLNRLKFAIDIPAEKTSVWKALWEDDYYRKWSAVFLEGSYMLAENWEEGGIVHFLGPDQSGIYSKIEQFIPFSIISFKHIGKVAEGKPQPIDEETKTWSGATETYKLIEGKNTVKLEVEIDIMEEHLEFMKDKFPKALELIKENSCL